MFLTPCPVSDRTFTFLLFLFIDNLSVFSVASVNKNFQLWKENKQTFLGTCQLKATKTFASFGYCCSKVPFLKGPTSAAFFCGFPSPVCRQSSKNINKLSSFFFFFFLAFILHGRKEGKLRTVLGSVKGSQLQDQKDQCTYYGMRR